MTITLVIIIAIVAVAVLYRIGEYLYKKVPGNNLVTNFYEFTQFATQAISAAKILLGAGATNETIARRASEYLKAAFPDTTDLAIEAAILSAMPTPKIPRVSKTTVPGTATTS